MKKQTKPANRVISAAITCGKIRHRWPSDGENEYGKIVEAVQHLGIITIFQNSEAVATFKPTVFFAPPVAVGGMWYRGEYEGETAELCINSLMDGGDKVNTNKSVILSSNYKFARQ